VRACNSVGPLYLDPNMLGHFFVCCVNDGLKLSFFYHAFGSVNDHWKIFGGKLKCVGKFFERFFILRNTRTYLACIPLNGGGYVYYVYREDIRRVVLWSCN